MQRLGGLGAEDTMMVNKIQVEEKKYNKTTVILKMIFLGILLPAFDLGTDLMAIYQYWISNQWVLNYLAVGLMLALLGHNFVSALYGRKNWATLSPTGTAKGFTCSPCWRAGRVLLYGLGLGNIPTTTELIVEVAFQKRLNQR